MTDGTSQGLFIVVAIVIFGIFVVLAYILFEDTLSPAMASMFTTATEQATDNIFDQTSKENTSFFTYEIINDGESVKITGYSAEAPKDVIIPNRIENLPVTEIGKHSFFKMGITSVKLPKYLERIEAGQHTTSGAFAYNKLKTLKLPESLTFIGSETFINNELVDVSFGNSVEIIGSDAFFYNKLEKLVLPDSLKEIHWNAFGANEISEVDLGNGIVSIDRLSFNLNPLKKINIPRSVKYIGYLAFGNSHLMSEINVPKELEGTYKKDSSAFAKKGAYTVEKGYHNFENYSESIITYY